MFVYNLNKIKIRLQLDSIDQKTEQRLKSVKFWYTSVYKFFVELTLTNLLSSESKISTVERFIE